MKDFIPDESHIVSASEVTNIFPKKKRTDEESEGDDDSEESDGELQISEDELAWAKEIKEQINREFSRNKNPEPLFQLDLIKKSNQLIPMYNNNPADIVAKIKEVFE